MRKIPTFKLMRGKLRPSLLLVTAVAAGASALAQTASLGAQEQKPKAPADAQSRLGNIIGQDISERDRAFAQRARAMDLRERSLRAAEEQVKSGAGQPAGAAASTGDAAGVVVPQPIEELARIYQAMKPARAAAIFSALEPDVQTQIARQMRNRSVALLMANMEPGAAARLSMRLAGRNPNPVPIPASARAPIPLAPPPGRAAPAPAPTPTRAAARPATRPTPIRAIAKPAPAPIAAPAKAAPAAREETPSTTQS